MIDKSKQYRTRDGREVRIYATDGGASYSHVHGAIWKPFDDNPHYESEWSLTCWSQEGKHVHYKYDLIEVRPRHKRTVWLNVCDHHTFLYESRKDADCIGDDDRIACIKVDLDFEEGEGL